MFQIATGYSTSIDENSDFIVDETKHYNGHNPLNTYKNTIFQKLRSVSNGRSNRTSQSQQCCIRYINVYVLKIVLKNKGFWVFEETLLNHTQASFVQQAVFIFQHTFKSQ